MVRTLSWPGRVISAATSCGRSSSRQFPNMAARMSRARALHQALSSGGVTTYNMWYGSSSILATDRPLRPFGDAGRKRADARGVCRAHPQRAYRDTCPCPGSRDDAVPRPNGDDIGGVAVSFYRWLASIQGG